MRILHTSDWHVGKGMRGQSRLDEHVAVLAEIAEIAAREAVDLVVVAGDLYESASPTADADKVVFDALLGLRAVAPVVVIAGNHDNGARFEAIRPVFDRMGI
ncbi:MAG: metallophosphoesterase family protein, partial [Acidimicrobiia bacterium]